MHKCENSKAWGLLLNTDSCIYTWMDASKTSICTTTEKPVKLVLSDSHSCTLQSCKTTGPLRVLVSHALIHGHGHNCAQGNQMLESCFLIVKK